MYFIHGARVLIILGGRAQQPAARGYPRAAAQHLPAPATAPAAAQGVHPQQASVRPPAAVSFAGSSGPGSAAASSAPGSLAASSYGGSLAASSQAESAVTSSYAGSLAASSQAESAGTSSYAGSLAASSQARSLAASSTPGSNAASSHGAYMPATGLRSEPEPLQESCAASLLNHNWGEGTGHTDVSTQMSQ